MSGLLNAFGFGNSCGNDCDDNFIWILVIVLLFSGCNDNSAGCGLFGGDNIWLIVLLVLFCCNNNDPCDCNPCTCETC